MEKSGTKFKILGHFTEIIQQSKIKEPLHHIFFLAVWIDSPSVTVVETLAHPIDEVSFPAVTICPQDFNSDRWGTTIKIMDYFQWKCPTLG